MGKMVQLEVQRECNTLVVDEGNKGGKENLEVVEDCFVHQSSGRVQGKEVLFEFGSHGKNTVIKEWNIFEPASDVRSLVFYHVKRRLLGGVMRS